MNTKHITYLDYGHQKVVVYGSRNFNVDDKKCWLDYWASTSVWIVPGTYHD